MKNKILFICSVLCLAFTLPLCGAEADFDSLMGKNTQHWLNVKSQEDLTFLQLCKNTYEKNQGLRFHNSQQTKIPKVVHFIWLGPRPFPPYSVENVRTWMAQNPDWTFKYWTDRDRSPPCNGMERILVQQFPFQVLGSRFADSENYGEKSDILRYEILFQEGGVYVDHDANCLQPFDGLHSAYDFYCCLEAPHPLMAGSRITCGNGVIGARPGHPVIGKILEVIDQRWDSLAKQFRGRDKYSQAEIVLNRTYIALTKALEGNLNQDGNVDIVLPAAFFFAKGGMTPLYSKHFFANAWADHSDVKLGFERELEKQLGKIRQKSQKTAFFGYAELLLIACLILTASLYFYRFKKYEKKI